MQRSIRRQIIRETTGNWAEFQRARYGEQYNAISKSGTRTRHYHHNPVVDRHAAKVIGFGAVLKNALTKLFRRPARRREAVA